ncbi:Alpha/Beta hydrolase protein [Xylaria palmicola]|nr:Alpha/Beta hydrolase protein [Xylaria palmicola]
MATEHALLGKAAEIPVGSTSPIISFTPVVIPSPGRPVELHIRVTAPVSGDNLPIILLSHGHGPSNWLSSSEGYAPLAEFWAKHGFVVIQPTHLSSRSLSLQSSEGHELFFRSNSEDHTHILDQLDHIESTVPGLQGRLDKSKVAGAGHSYGATTMSMLLGAENTDPRDGATFRHHEKRIKAGVLFGGTGNGGADLSENGRRMIPWYGLGFGGLTTPTLVIGGEDDVSPHLTVRGADWHWDAYRHGPGATDLLRVKGGHHGFGGISGWDGAETKDGSPERLGLVQRMSLAYLKSRLSEGDKSWEQACEALAGLEELGSVESKSQ